MPPDAPARTLLPLRAAAHLYGTATAASDLDAAAANDLVDQALGVLNTAS